MTDDLDFFERIGTEVTPIRVCNRAVNTLRDEQTRTRGCRILVTTDTSLGSPQKCVLCQRHFVTCTCGRGAGPKDGAQYCYVREDCEKLHRGSYE